MLMFMISSVPNVGTQWPTGKIVTWILVLCCTDESLSAVSSISAWKTPSAHGQSPKLNFAGSIATAYISVYPRRLRVNVVSVHAFIVALGISITEGGLLSA